MTHPKLRILGIRGVPAAHGGFETFAEHLSPFLAAKGWKVTVYCQEVGDGPIWEDTWRGVHRVHIPVRGNGPKSTIVFDWLSVRHAAGFNELCLTLGYNTAAFGALLRAKGIRNVINMDGIEWSRAKWGPVARSWFWMNERMGCWLGDHLVADHPEIKLHLATRVRAEKISTIAYGAPTLSPELPSEPLDVYGLESSKYLTVIARPEPENSLLEIVRGFSARPRGVQLAVLGNYSSSNPYHVKVKEAASDEVHFLGGIYDQRIVESLRVHALGYLHGHRVGGTNPSLVEALGAGNPVIAHDNRFNRWVAGPQAAMYFQSGDDVDAAVTRLLESENLATQMGEAARARHAQSFTWSNILAKYEDLLVRNLPPASRRVAAPAVEAPVSGIDRARS